MKEVIMIKIDINNAITRYNNIESWISHYSHSQLKTVPGTKLIEVGGKAMIMIKDETGRTALYYACANKAPV